MLVYTYAADPGLTTAAHCKVTNPKIAVNGHWVTLDAPTIVNYSEDYDFEVHPTGSLDISGYVA